MHLAFLSKGSPAKHVGKGCEVFRAFVFIKIEHDEMSLTVKNGKQKFNVWHQITFIQLHSFRVYISIKIMSKIWLTK